MSYAQRQPAVYQGSSSQYLSFAARHPRLYATIIVPLFLSAIGFFGLACNGSGTRETTPTEPTKTTVPRPTSTPCFRRGDQVTVYYTGNGGAWFSEYCGEGGVKTFWLTEGQYKEVENKSPDMAKVELTKDLTNPE